jgi:hypothetical protein
MIMMMISKDKDKYYDDFFIIMIGGCKVGHYSAGLFTALNRATQGHGEISR